MLLPVMEFAMRIAWQETAHRRRRFAHRRFLARRTVDGNARRLGCRRGGLYGLLQFHRISMQRYHHNRPNLTLLILEKMMATFDTYQNITKLD